MKKLVFALFVAACGLGMTSCSTTFKSATQRDVVAPLAAAVIGDLDVSNQKITYTYYPTKTIRRGGYANCKNAAIREALAQYGDADVLIETQEATVIRTGGIFKRAGKIKAVTVTGYPAKYKNFRSADEETVKAGIVNGVLVHGQSPASVRMINGR